MRCRHAPKRRASAWAGVALGLVLLIVSACDSTPPPAVTEMPSPPAATGTPAALTANVYLPHVAAGDGSDGNRPNATATPLPATLVPATLVPTSTAGATATPTATPTPEPCLDPGPPPPENAPPLVGLHASADPVITWQERCTFIELRPSIVKVQSFHPPQDIARLAATQPQARWVVRVFLEFGGRAITPDEFVAFTLSDTRRTLDVLAGRDVVVELHNEPNLVAEGWQAAWQDGAGFQAWYLDVLAQYRAALPGVRFLFPAASPGGDIAGVRTDHVPFLEANRAAIEASDGLAVHLYWAANAPIEDALATLDDLIARFPEMPLWITEASYNKGGIDDRQRAQSYLTFIEALRQRPAVQGVTFFVASAQDPTFAPETWVGKQIAPLVGARGGE